MKVRERGSERAIEPFCLTRVLSPSLLLTLSSSTRAFILQSVKLLHIGVAAFVLDLSDNRWVQIPLVSATLTNTLGCIGLFGSNLLAAVVVVIYMSLWITAGHLV
jgi:hypothetical protein